MSTLRRGWIGGAGKERVLRVMLRLVLVVVSMGLCLAQAPVGTDQLVADVLRDWNVPGLALGVVRNGAVVHQRGYGLRDVEKKLPVTVGTSFAYGSITKSLTVLLLHSLAAEGKLDWDAPVRDQLPGFKLADPVASERATPRDLVSHRTGMPRHDALWAVAAPPTREEILARLRFLPASADFRTTYQYNNLMFVTAGILAAHAGEGKWEELLRRRVLAPLALGEIAATYSEVKGRAELAVPYTRKGDGYRAIGVTPGLDVIAPAGAAAGTIEALTKYLLVHMNAGKVNGRQALPAAFFAKMRTPLTPMPETGADSPFSAGQAYGMGLFIGRYQGRTMIYHTGTISGYHAMMWWLPEEKLGVTVLLNRVERAAPHILALTLADRMLGLPATDWSAVYKKALRPAAEPAKPVAGTQPGHTLAHYAGEYFHGGYGRVNVTEDGGVLTFVRAGEKAELKHFHYDSFLAGTERVTFHTDAEGVVSSVEMRLEPAVPPIVFVRKK